MPFYSFLVKADKNVGVASLIFILDELCEGTSKRVTVTINMTPYCYRQTNISQCIRVNSSEDVRLRYLSKTFTKLWYVTIAFKT